MNTLGQGLVTIERQTKRINLLEARMDRMIIKITAVERFLRTANPERKARSAKSLAPVREAVPANLSELAKNNNLGTVSFQTAFEEIQKAKARTKAANDALPVPPEETIERF